MASGWGKVTVWGKVTKHDEKGKNYTARWERPTETTPGLLGGAPGRTPPDLHFIITNAKAGKTGMFFFLTGLKAVSSSE